MTDALNRTGDTVKEPSDYRAACCKATKTLVVDELFPQCPEHGDTKWEKIPSIEAIEATNRPVQPPPMVSGPTPQDQPFDPTAFA